MKSALENVYRSIGGALYAGTGFDPTHDFCYSYARTSFLSAGSSFGSPKSFAEAVQAKEQGYS